MPVSYDGVCSVVDGAVRKSLQSCCDVNQLSQRVAAASQRVLLHKISFQPAEHSGESQLASMRMKYSPLNASSRHNNQKASDKQSRTESTNGMDAIESALPVPRVVLFAPERLRADWSSKWHRVGGGLRNMGNTCYMNAVLQCLTYTAPLHSFVCANEHKNGYQQGCMTCAVQMHAKGCLGLHGGVITPYKILKQLQALTRRFHFGKQEDAHECLRTIMSAMQASCLQGRPKLDKVSQLTTAVHQIFGGHLQSQVVCLRCKVRSTVYEPFLDLSVDVVRANSVPEAMEQFTRVEKLEGDNAYYCAKCRQKVVAHKLLAMHAPAKVLTVHLKRFNTHNGKVNRHIRFFPNMDIRPYMCVKKGDPVIYELYAVLVHQGSTTYSGHYFAYIKAPDSKWYCMNDAMVIQSSLKEVLSANAYMLFYMHRDIPKGNIHTSKGVMHTSNSGIQTPIGTMQMSKGTIQTSDGTIQPRGQRIHFAFASQQQERKVNNELSAVDSDIGMPVDHSFLEHNRPRISFNLHNKKNEHNAMKRPCMVLHKGNGGITRDSSSTSNNTFREVSTDITQKVNKETMEGKVEDEKVIHNVANVNTECKDKMGESIVVDSIQNANVESGEEKKINLEMQTKGNTVTGSETKKVTCMRDDRYVVAKEKSKKSASEIAICNIAFRKRMENGNVVNGIKEMSKADVSEKQCPTKNKSMNGSNSCVDKMQPNTLSDRYTEKLSSPLNNKAGKSAIKVGSFVQNDTTTTTTSVKDYQAITAKSLHGHPAEIDVSVANSWIVRPLASPTSSGSSVPSTDWQITDHLGGCTNSSVASGWKVTKQVGKRSHDMIADTNPAAVAVFGTSSVTEHMQSVEGEKFEKRKKRKHADFTRVESDKQANKRKQKRQKKKVHATTDVHNHGQHEFVWVEKTLDTIEHNQLKKKVPALHSWDEHINDGVTKNKQYSTWNGIRMENGNVLEQLQNSATQGYGSEVLSWSGGRSALDLQTEADRANERKRKWLNSYYNDDDDRLDRGKTKKLHKHKCIGEFHQNRPNTFQKFQDHLKAGSHCMPQADPASSARCGHHQVHHNRRHHQHKNSWHKHKQKNHRR